MTGQLHEDVYSRTSPGGYAWVAVAAVVLVVTLAIASGSGGVLHGLLYALAVTPGAILGRRLTGPHPAGWIIGATLGYGTTQIALWLPIFAGVASAITFILAWLLQAGLLLWLARRISRPSLHFPDWSSADLRATAAIAVLVAAVMVIPYRNVGAQDESGTRYYRAYFTADFVWHTALAAELGRYRMPPRNPYMASRPMNYYWTYFLMPAAVAQEAPGPLDDVQAVLKANAMMSALLLAGLMFLLTRMAVPCPGLAALAVSLGITAASAEGSFVLQQLWRTGRPLASVEALNIDAITAWQFSGLRVDSLVRGFWYNPQHSFACALGMVSMLVAASGGARAGWGAVGLVGVTLGLATTFNPFVGGVFALIYGIGITIDGVRTRDLAALLRHATAAVPVLLGLAWCGLNAVTGNAGEAVTISLRGFTRPNAGTSLLLSTGPMLIPAIVGTWPRRQLPGKPALVAGVGAALVLVMMHTVTLSEASWVGFRTGQILQLLLPVLVARALWQLRQASTTATILTVLVIALAGLPTTIIDTYNAQDITNRERSAGGFRWTIAVTAEQRAAFEWIERELPEDAVVQMEPILRGREHWSLIPSFAERRMSAGIPISLLPTPEYDQGSKEVRQVFSTADPREAWQLARRRRIDYLYVDGEDRAAYPEGTAKFDGQPAYFEQVFANSEVALYRVR